MKINELIPDEAMQAWAMTTSTEFHRWACKLGLGADPLFLQILTFPSR